MAAYFIANEGVQEGPFELAELASKRLLPSTLVWREGMARWMPADSVDEVRALIARAAAPLAVQPIEAPGAGPGVTGPPVPSRTPVGYASSHGKNTSGMAIASLVLGLIADWSICGMHIGVIVGLPCAILAVVFGVIAKRQIDRGEASGRAMAIIGIVCGTLYLVLLTLLLIAVVLGVVAMSRGWRI